MNEALEKIRDARLLFDETIVPGRSGWIEDRDDPDAIVRRILWCANSSEAMRRASRVAIRHARERFSIDKAVDRYLEQIDSR